VLICIRYYMYFKIWWLTKYTRIYLNNKLLYVWKADIYIYNIMYLLYLWITQSYKNISNVTLLRVLGHRLKLSNYVQILFRSFSYILENKLLVRIWIFMYSEKNLHIMIEKKYRYLVKFLMLTPNTPLKYCKII